MRVCAADRVGHRRKLWHRGLDDRALLGGGGARWPRVCGLPRTRDRRACTAAARRSRCLADHLPCRRRRCVLYPSRPPPLVLRGGTGTGRCLCCDRCAAVVLSWLRPSPRALPVAPSVAQHRCVCVSWLLLQRRGAGRVRLVLPRPRSARTPPRHVHHSRRVVTYASFTG